ncbi:MAG: AAA family ATPase [archaeon]
MLIGLVGTLGSGKGTVREILEDKGFKTKIFSVDVLEKELNKRKIPITRKSLRDIGSEIRSKEGLNAIAFRLIKSLDLNEDCVIDGARNLGEVEEMKKHGFIIVGVDAPIKIRFDRLVFRAGPKDFKTWDEFIEQEKKDLDEKKPTGQQNALCMKQAKHIIINDLNHDVLVKKVDKLLENLR